MFERFKRLFKKQTSSAVPAQVTFQTTAANPFIIKNPSLGMLNLAGEAGRSLFNKDLDDLGALFPKNVNIGIGQIPRCNVLFLYCALEPSGRVVGQSFSLRDAIKAAGAQIAVVAMDVDSKVLQSPEFSKFFSSKSDWPANIVVTTNRNGDAFPKFFEKLFGQMRDGVTMPVAWVTLAPQNPHAQSAGPGALCLLEAGHIAFSKS